MRSILKMPKVGDAANEVVIMELLVKVGDTVSAGQNLFTVGTDKATLDVPAAFGGTVSEILVKVGEEVPTGAPTVVLEG